MAPLVQERRHGKCTGFQGRHAWHSVMLMARYKSSALWLHPTTSSFLQASIAAPSAPISSLTS